MLRSSRPDLALCRQQLPAAARIRLPFDLLYWNSDSTRMPAANHSFYLRNCYLENNLSHGQDDAGRHRRCRCPTSRSRSTISPPGRTTSRRPDRSSSAASYFGGEVDYVMAGSGHIAGVVNPPDKKKYQYLDRRRTDGRIRGLGGTARGDTRAPGGRTGTHGSSDIDDASVPARKPGGAACQPDRGCAGLLCPRARLGLDAFRSAAGPRQRLIARYKRFLFDAISRRHGDHRLLPQYRLDARPDHARLAHLAVGARQPDAQIRATRWN